MRERVLKPLVFTLSLAPLVRLLWLARHNGLGANPIEAITHQTGLLALIFLLVGLAVTPLRRTASLLWLIRYRRMLGLFAFFYASLHLVTYVWLDQFFNLHSMLKDVAKRPFITMGTTAFLLMVPLALTSTQWAIRRLGRRWGQLHRLVYASAAAAVIHFLWLVKRDISEPLLYAGVLALLLGYRVVSFLVKRSTPPASAPAAAAPGTRVGLQSIYEGPGPQLKS